VQPLGEPSLMAPAMQKEPWLAVSLSYALPGAGQIYTGKIVRGGLVLLATLAALTVGFWSLCSERGDVRLGLACLIGFGLFWLFNCFDAHRCCRKANDPAFESARKQSKDPCLAAWLTLVFPGLGHFYARKRVRRLLVLAGYFLGVIIIEACFGADNPSEMIHPLSSLYMIAYIFTAACWAYPSVPSGRQPMPVAVWRVLACVCIYFGVLHFCLRSVRGHYLEPFRVSSRSMAPCLEVADRILVDKSLAVPLARGDVAAFYNHKSESIWVHRVVAFAGERIAIGEADGKLYVNSKRVDEPPFDQLTFTHTGKYAIHGQEHLVGPDSFFALGDNSARSSDSRMDGDVPMTDLRGVAYKIWFPLSRAGPIRAATNLRAGQPAEGRGNRGADF